MRPTDDAIRDPGDVLMSLAAIEARARAKAGQADPRLRAKRFTASEAARKQANLKAAGIVIPLSEWIGHNNGPAWDVETLFLDYCWSLAHKRAWTPPTPEIGIRRARNAVALGVSYKTYVLEILERGRYLDDETAAPLRGT